MTITVLADVVLPNSVITAGLRGKNMRRNTRSVNQGGYGEINVDWVNTLRQYDFGFVPMLMSLWQTIEGLHEVTDGGAFGFLMEDPKDSTVAPGAGVLMPTLTTPFSLLVGTPGFGYGVPAYRLGKRYGSIGSARVKDRVISRPRAAGAAFLRAGAPITLGGSPGNAALDADTGTLTFVPDATRTVSAVTVGATTSVTLSSALPGLAGGDRLWLQGLTGADAALLNNQSHEINSVVGAVYSLATDTSGATITPAGEGHQYPQFDEALTWSGAFYTPVHFQNDDLDWDLVLSGPVDQRLIMGQSIVLQEIRE